MAALARVKALARLEAADATDRGDVVGAAVLGALAARVEEELGPRRRDLERRAAECLTDLRGYATIAAEAARRQSLGARGEEVPYA